MGAPLELSKEDTRERKRLLGFMTRPGPRFGLATALFADARHAAAVREDLTAASREQGQRVGVLEFSFEDGERDLVAAIQAAGKANIEVLFVLNLELLVVDAAGVLRRTSAVANLNQRRDELPQLLDVRVVFWLPQEADRPLSEVAWDLCQMMLTTAEFSGELAFGELELEQEEELPAWMEAAPPQEHAALLGQLENLQRVLLEESGSELGGVAQSAGELEVRLGQLSRGRERLREAASLYSKGGYTEEAVRAAQRAAEVSLALGELEAADEDVQLGLQLVSEELPAASKEAPAEAFEPEADAPEADEIMAGALEAAPASALQKRRADSFEQLDAADDEDEAEEMLGLGDALTNLDADIPMSAPELSPAPLPPSAAPRPALQPPPAAAAGSAPPRFGAPGRPPPVALPAAKSAAPRSKAPVARPKALAAFASRPARTPRPAAAPTSAVPTKPEVEAPRSDSSAHERARQSSGPQTRAWRESGPSQAISELAVTTALVSARQGKLEVSRAQLEQALEGFRAAEDHANCARVYGHLAQLHEDAEEYVEALELRREHQLPAYLLAQDEQGSARARVKIAELLARTGEVRASLRLIREQVLPALAAFEPDATPQREAVTTLAAVLEAAGQPRVAAQLRHQFGEPEEPENSDGDPPPPPPPPPLSDPQHDSSASTSGIWTEQPLDHRRPLLLLAIVIVASMLLIASI